MGHSKKCHPIRWLHSLQNKAGAHIGIAEGEDGAFLVDSFRHHELEVTILVLGDAQIGHIAHRGIELGQIAAAGLAVEYGHDLHSRLLRLRNVRVAGAGVTDDANVLVKVNGVHFGQLAGAGNGLENAHSHGDLDIALHSAGGALLNQHGEGGNQHGVQLSGDALSEAVVVGGYESDLLILDPLLEGHNIASHIPDGLHRGAALDVEGVQDILRLGADGSLVGDVVSNGPHLFPVELLGVQLHPVVEVGFVDVQIHHAGVPWIVSLRTVSIISERCSIGKEKTDLPVFAWLSIIRRTRMESTRLEWPYLPVWRTFSEPFPSC